jgi:hypothetical protein
MRNSTRGSYAYLKIVVTGILFAYEERNAIFSSSVANFPALVTISEIDNNITFL